MAAVSGSLVALVGRGQPSTRMAAGEIFGGTFTNAATETGVLVGFVVLVAGAAVQYIRYFYFGKQTSSTVHSFLTLATLTIIGIFIANSGNPRGPSAAELAFQLVYGLP